MLPSSLPRWKAAAADSVRSFSWLAPPPDFFFFFFYLPRFSTPGPDVRLCVTRGGISKGRAGVEISREHFFPPQFSLCTFTLVATRSFEIFSAPATRRPLCGR